MVITVPPSISCALGTAPRTAPLEAREGLACWLSQCSKVFSSTPALPDRIGVGATPLLLLRCVCCEVCLTAKERHRAPRQLGAGASGSPYGRQVAVRPSLPQHRPKQKIVVSLPRPKRSCMRRPAINGLGFPTGLLLVVFALLAHPRNAQVGRLGHEEFPC